jgi:hypothetical protein
MDAAHNVSPNSDQLLLRPSKWKWTLLLLASIAFVATGIWMINVGGPMSQAPVGDARFWGWATAIFFGLGIPISLVQLFSSRTYLSLTPEGFTMGTLWGSRTNRWADVTSFVSEVITYRPWPLRPLKMVRFDYSSPSSTRPKLRAFARAVSGHDAVLPDTYGMRAEDLAELMNRWRSRYANGARG